MFFRDSRAFAALERHAIRPILDEQARHLRATKGVRAWVVGCATGEEAYSLAILLMEKRRRRKLHVPIQIFATDLDEGALATAREGRYPKTIEANVSEERLARFFVDEGTHYRVRKEVRDNGGVRHFTACFKDPPFMRLDLISCRNLLIYLERSLQQQLYTLFHYGLKEGRFLFLGSAETVDTSTELFIPLDRDAHIYAARHQTVQTIPILAHFTSPERRSTAAARPSIRPRTRPGRRHAAFEGAGTGRPPQRAGRRQPEHPQPGADGGPLPPALRRAAVQPASRRRAAGAAP